MEKIKIASAKGYLSAVVHRPKEMSGKLAVICPGYLDSKDYRHMVTLAKMLSERGYVTVRFDPIGTWESSGEIADYNATQYLEDIKTVINQLSREHAFEHILLGGHSRGGRMSILYAARDPRISLVLGIMPSTGFFDHEEWKQAGVKISKRDLPENKNEQKEFRVPFSHVLDLEKYDALGDAAKIKVPVILIAGELDDIVLPEEVVELADKIHGIKKLAIIPRIGHDYRRNEEEISIVNKVIAEQLDSVEL
jgi:pimeloyl-ACP methyl ester carboxylesterase